MAKTIKELQQELQMLHESKMYDAITLMKYERKIKEQIQLLLKYEMESTKSKEMYQ